MSKQVCKSLAVPLGHTARSEIWLPSSDRELGAVFPSEHSGGQPLAKGAGRGTILDFNNRAPRDRLLRESQQITSADLAGGLGPAQPPGWYRIQLGAMIEPVSCHF